MVLNKLEIDVMQANELYEAVRLTVKYKLPAMIVHQDLASEAYIARGQTNGQFKLITPIDWPKGNIFSTQKMRGLSTDALEVEGFEILLTGNMKMIETRNEVKALTEFVKTYLDETIEIRFVLGTLIRDEENIKDICEALLDVRMPAYIRNDTQLKLQVSKANPDIHNDTMEMINDTIRIPIKISGNVNGVRTITSCLGASRFAVSLLQAKIIIKEFNQQPEQLRELLTNDADS